MVPPPPPPPPPGSSDSEPPDVPARAREEFFSEAQEIVDALARDLVQLDDGLRKNTVEPETINDLFRGVHTLKGLSGLFGLERLSKLTHVLEDQLDELRLGRITLDHDVLDRLFRAVELIGRLLAAARSTGRDDDAELDGFLRELEGASEEPSAVDDGLGDYALDAELVGVLTEYEEHRLKTNIRAGVPLYRIRAAFPLMTIDKGLEDLKSRAKALGELVTFLPTADSNDPDALELEILFASATPLDQLRGRIESATITVQPVPKRSRPGAGRTESPSAETAERVAAARVQSAAVDDRPSEAPLRDPLENTGEQRPVSLTPGGGSSIRPEGQTVGELPLDERLPAPPRGVAEGASDAPDAYAALASPPRDGATPVPPRRATPVVPRPEAQGVGRDLEAHDDPARVLALRGAHTVRVDIRRLDHLMNILGELAIVRGALSRLTDRMRQTPGMREVTSELHRLHRAFDRNLADMQSGILEVRMVPLGHVFEYLTPKVRQESRKQGKPVRLVITGADTEVDKLIVEELKNPLIHIANNAIAHGIEPAIERERLGKPSEGTIALNAYQAGNHVMIEIEDDGGGIDEQRVLATALRKGIVREEETRELSRREILNLIFLPGFSTTDSVTEAAGRGVGLDAVKTSIGRLGGVVDVSSEPGIGTKFTITLPITLAILRALLIGVAGRQYALPLSSVAEATVLDPGKIRTVEGREITSMRGETLPLCRLDRLFGHPRREGRAGGRAFVVVVTLGGRRVGFVVDELYGQQDIVIKPLGRSLAGVRGFAGATDLGDQRVGLVLDAGALLEEVLAGGVGQDRRRNELGSGRRFV